MELSTDRCVLYGWELGRMGTNRSRREAAAGPPRQQQGGNGVVAAAAGAWAAIPVIQQGGTMQGRGSESSFRTYVLC
jgi:hypothetical protein